MNNIDLENEAEEYANNNLDSYDLSIAFIAGANSNYVKQQVLKGKIEMVLQIYNDLFCNGTNYLNVCIDHKKILEIELKQLETPKI